jgi:diguanylate cyclase (GGDEF)-like protein
MTSSTRQLPFTPLRPRKLDRLKPARVSAHRQSVLVVDDTRSVRELLCRFVDELGTVRSEPAGTMEEARALLAANPERFFCAALDLNLPDAPDGEVVDVVASYGIPIIVLTASGDPQTREKMLAKQIVDYVIKCNAGEIEHVAYLIGRLRENNECKVVVADDSPSFRGYVKALLDRYRYRTFAACNGREALDIVEQHPDTTLVVTDVHMPVMDGLELIHGIRMRHRREDLAIIGISDLREPGLSARLLKSGANDFLSKPFAVEEFYCRITQNTNMVGYLRYIRDAATRDYLTGVHNRRHLFEAGETIYRKARAEQATIAIGMIDADHFKRINDTWGHHAGDEALKVIAETMRVGDENGHLIARHGGEEFVCIARLPRREDAWEFFEQIRHRIASAEIAVGGQRIPLTVSIGVTTELGDSLEDMLQRADVGTYQAKAGGRNRVVLV